VAVVVNYNAASHLPACLTSLVAEGIGDIIVVDNGSVDGSEAVVAAVAPRARWVPLGANLGYGEACNLAAALCPGRDLLICNPDLELHAGAVAAMRRRLEGDPSLAVVGPRLLNEDGTTYPSIRTFPNLVDAVGHGLFGMVAPRNRFTRRYRMLDLDHTTTSRVDWVSGACFLIRRDAWDAIGGFDARYFMYLEDVDLCWRAGRAGWTVGYEPDAEVVHTQGVSAAQHPYRMLVAHHRSMWRFARQSAVGPGRLALPVVAVGLGFRVVVASAQHRFGRYTAQVVDTQP
jgi:N-acetylglucosaminyl-diphospho-decaprenol L-rhamnosyltransferase